MTATIGNACQAGRGGGLGTAGWVAAGFTTIAEFAAAVEGQAEGRGVGVGASADASCGFDDGHRMTGRDQSMGGRETG